MIRVVLDTNVLVRAIISDRKSRELLKRGIERQYQLVASDLILKELVSVLNISSEKTKKYAANYPKTVQEIADMMVI